MLTFGCAEYTTAGADPARYFPSVSRIEPGSYVEATTRASHSPEKSSSRRAMSSARTARRRRSRALSRSWYIDSSRATISSSSPGVGEAYEWRDVEGKEGLALTGRIVVLLAVHPIEHSPRLGDHILREIHLCEEDVRRGRTVGVGEGYYPPAAWFKWRASVRKTSRRIVEDLPPIRSSIAPVMRPAESSTTRYRPPGRILASDSSCATVSSRR